MKSPEKKQSEEKEKKNCPYLNIIQVFKNAPEYHKENSEKYTAITNRASILSSIRNTKMDKNQDEENFFDKIKEVTEININDEKKGKN